MKFKKTEEFIKKKLQKELPAHLYYHSINHVADVLSAAIRLAEAEKINEKDFVLLKTAVLFHDSGFITQSKNHEELSCEIVREALPD